jgi:hypothetical protein
MAFLPNPPSSQVKPGNDTQPGIEKTHPMEYTLDTFQKAF